MDAIVAELDEIPPVMLEAIGSTSALGPERMRYLGETIGDPWRPLPHNPLLHNRLRRWLGG